jgi:hypothetical protein
MLSSGSLICTDVPAPGLWAAVAVDELGCVIAERERLFVTPWSNVPLAQLQLRVWGATSTRNAPGVPR